MRFLKYSRGVVPRFLSGVSRGELLQLHLVINVTGLVEPTEPGSVWEKFYLHLPLTSTYLVELLAAEYLRETNNQVYVSFIIFCSLDALKKSSKKKET